MFVHRISELDLLEKRYHSSRAELFVLYGGWRVGKTDVLAHFCQGKRHVLQLARLDKLNVESARKVCPRRWHA